MTTFKNAPKTFQVEATEKIKTHIGIDYFSRIYPQIETIKVQPMENQINCKTTGKNWDTDTYSICLNQYGPTKCATNLVACTRVGKNMQELTQYSSFSKNTNQSTEGKLCDNSM